MTNEDREYNAQLLELMAEGPITQKEVLEVVAKLEERLPKGKTPIPLVNLGGVIVAYAITAIRMGDSEAEVAIEGLAHYSALCYRAGIEEGLRQARAEISNN